MVFVKLDIETHLQKCGVGADQRGRWEQSRELGQTHVCGNLVNDRMVL